MSSPKVIVLWKHHRKQSMCTPMHSEAKQTGMFRAKKGLFQGYATRMGRETPNCPEEFSKAVFKIQVGRGVVGCVAKILQCQRSLVLVSVQVGQ